MKTVKLILIFLTLVFATQPAPAQRMETGFLNRTITVGGSEYRYVTSGVNYPSLSPAGTEDVFEFVAKRVSALPIWIFHGDADDRVSVEESRKMNAALRAAKANVQYTELPGVAHNAWDPAYARADLIEWMLKQHRR